MASFQQDIEKQEIIDEDIDEDVGRDDLEEVDDGLLLNLRAEVRRRRRRSSPKAGPGGDLATGLSGDPATGATGDATSCQRRGRFLRRAAELDATREASRPFLAARAACVEVGLKIRGPPKPGGGDAGLDLGLSLATIPGSRAPKKRPRCPAATPDGPSPKRRPPPCARLSGPVLRLFAFLQEQPLPQLLPTELTSNMLPRSGLPEKLVSLCLSLNPARPARPVAVSSSDDEDDDDDANGNRDNGDDGRDDAGDDVLGTLPVNSATWRGLARLLLLETPEVDATDGDGSVLEVCCALVDAALQRGAMQGAGEVVADVVDDDARPWFVAHVDDEKKVALFPTARKKRDADQAGRDQAAVIASVVLGASRSPYVREQAGEIPAARCCVWCGGDHATLIKDAHDQFSHAFCSDYVAASSKKQEEVKQRGPLGRDFKGRHYWAFPAKGEATTLCVEHDDDEWLAYCTLPAIAEILRRLAEDDDDDLSAAVACAFPDAAALLLGGGTRSREVSPDEHGDRAAPPEAEVVVRALGASDDARAPRLVADDFISEAQPAASCVVRGGFLRVLAALGGDDELSLLASRVRTAAQEEAEPAATPATAAMAATAELADCITELETLLLARSQLRPQWRLTREAIGLTATLDGVALYLWALDGCVDYAHRQPGVY